jgi:glycosyltransferase involved in cell wall biosynthesis
LFVPYVYLVEKTGVIKSRFLVAITNNDAEFYARWVKKDKMIVIPQGIDDSIYNPFYVPKENDPKIVLFCGNFNIQPNRDVVKTVMEQILEEVLKECPNTIFRFIGANPPKDVKHPNVEFTGFVVDYPSCLREADIFISPMKEGWGSPTKIFEALACGKHVVATPIGARSVETDYQSLHLCEIDQFPHTICEVLKSGESVNARDFEKMKERYSWRANIRKLIDKVENFGE